MKKLKNVFLIISVIKNDTIPPMIKFTNITIIGLQLFKYVYVIYTKGEWNKYIPKLFLLIILQNLLLLSEKLQ